MLSPQSCLTLCNPLDCSLPVSSVHGIDSPGKNTSWVTMPSSRGSPWPRNQTLILLCFLHWQAGSIWLVPSGKPKRRNAAAAAAKSLHRVWLLATPWTAAYQAPPPMGFSRQEYWSGLSLPSLKGGIDLDNFISECYTWALGRPTGCTAE